MELVGFLESNLGKVAGLESQNVMVRLRVLKDKIVPILLTCKHNLLIGILVGAMQTLMSQTLVPKRCGKQGSFSLNAVQLNVNINCT